MRSRRTARAVVCALLATALVGGVSVGVTAALASPTTSHGQP